MDRVFEYFEKSVAISEKINDEVGQTRSYNNLGALYNHFEEYDKALDNYFKSLALAKKQNDQSQISQNLNNIAIAKYYQKKFDEATHYHEQSIIIKESLEDYAGMANGYMNFASLYNEHKKYKKAEEYYKRAIETIDEYTDSATSKVVAARSYATYLYSINRVEEGAKQFKAAILTNSNDLGNTMNGYTFQLKFAAEADLVLIDHAVISYMQAKEYYSQIINPYYKTMQLQTLEKIWALKPAVAKLPKP